MHLRELWRLKLGLAFAILLSLLVSLSSVQKIGLLPPKLSPRELEMGTASTHVLVDTPKSTAVNAKAKASALAGLTSRASLLGNVVVSPPVREFIARRAHIRPEQIQAVGPLTPDVPRALAEPGHEKRTSDILRSADQFRLDVQVQPTAPIIDIYAQAPNSQAAQELANAAVDGLGDYLKTVAGTQQIQTDDQVKLLQLGRARGSVINPRRAGAGGPARLLPCLQCLRCRRALRCPRATRLAVRARAGGGASRGRPRRRAPGARLRRLAG